VDAEAAGPRRSLDEMADDDDDIERIRSTIRVLRAAIDAALDSNAPLGVLESLTLQLLERQRRLAGLETRERVVRN
jgi:hypothetical protein